MFCKKIVCFVCFAVQNCKKFCITQKVLGKKNNRKQKSLLQPDTGLIISCLIEGFHGGKGGYLPFRRIVFSYVYGA